MIIDIVTGRALIAAMHIILGVLVLIFPNFLRFWIGFYLILLGIFLLI